MNDRTATAIRFPAELHEQLRRAADAHHVPINYLVVAAVREFLERLLPPEQIRLTRPRATLPPPPPGAQPHP